ncbi:MAG: GNAT family N-acetyltransferase [bacterium]
MIYDLLAKACQVVEILREKDRLRRVSQCFYWCGEMVPVERDLSSVSPVDALLRKLNAELIRLSPDNYRDYHLTYPIRSRRYKALRYLSKGYHSFTLIRDNEVLGDVWHARVGATRAELTHRDFNVLGISPGEKDVYLFDMFIDPNRRGQSLALPLLGGALYGLGQAGCAKGYGFFKADNIPALWVHRMLKYKELPRVRIERILGVTRVLARNPKT